MVILRILSQILTNSSEFQLLENFEGLLQNSEEHNLKFWCMAILSKSFVMRSKYKQWFKKVHQQKFLEHLKEYRLNSKMPPLSMILISALLDVAVKMFTGSVKLRSCIKCHIGKVLENFHSSNRGSIIENVVGQNNCFEKQNILFSRNKNTRYSFNLSEEKSGLKMNRDKLVHANKDSYILIDPYIVNILLKVFEFIVSLNAIAESCGGATFNNNNNNKFNAV